MNNLSVFICYNSQRIISFVNYSFRSVSYSVDVPKSIYEGRCINKLQNGAIPLILKIGKIRNIRFVGNLILNIQKNFWMMPSLL